MQDRNSNNVLGGYARKVWIAGTIGALMVALLFLLWHGFEVLLIIFAGLLLGLFILVPAEWLSHHSFLPQRGAMAVVFVALTCLVAAFGTLFATSLGDQFQQLIQALPDSLGELKKQVSSWPLGGELVSALEQGQSGGNMGEWFGRVSSVLSLTFGALVNIFFISLIALFVAFEPGTYRAGFLQLIPPSRRAFADDLLMLIRHKLNWWMLGRLVSMTVVGVATGIGLWLIGMPMALSLALLAGLLVFIPNLGPLLAAIPALLVALPEGLLWPVALLYLMVQLVESNLITPMIDRQSVKLAPALLISAQVSLGLIAGTLGLLLAAPLMVILMVIVRRVYIDGWLEGQ